MKLRLTITITPRKGRGQLLGEEAMRVRKKIIPYQTESNLLPREREQERLEIN